MQAAFNWILENPATFAALMSTVATALAAYATWRGPLSAAQMAEALRQNSEAASEKRRLKLLVFSTVMQERATIHSAECVRMLNSIDFIFDDSPAVREAWAELYNCFNTSHGIHPQLQEEKLRNLLKAMAASCGLSGSLRADDFGRVYYPNILARQQQIQSLMQETQLKELQARVGVGDAPSDFSSRFPPAPAA